VVPGARSAHQPDAFGAPRHSGRLRRSARVLFLAALIGPAAPASGQVAERANWRFLTSTDGLVESWTYDATRGPSGRLFISHGEVRELSVFDGYRIERLPAPGPYLTVREGPGGVLWAMLRQGGVGNFVYRGLQRLEGGRWVAYPFDDRAAAVFETPVLASSAAFVPLDHDRVLAAGGGRLLDCRL
jgi:hypothetical protein